MENRVQVCVAPGPRSPHARVPAAPIRAIEQDRHRLVIQLGLRCGLNGTRDHGRLINPPSTRRVQSGFGPWRKLGPSSSWEGNPVRCRCRTGFLVLINRSLTIWGAASFMQTRGFAFLPELRGSCGSPAGPVVGPSSPSVNDNLSLMRPRPALPRCRTGGAFHDDPRSSHRTDRYHRGADQAASSMRSPRNPRLRSRRPRDPADRRRQLPPGCARGCGPSRPSSPNSRGRVPRRSAPRRRHSSWSPGRSRAL